MIIVLVGKELKGVSITVPAADPETAHSGAPIPS